MCQKPSILAHLKAWKKFKTAFSFEDIGTKFFWGSQKDHSKLFSRQIFDMTSQNFFRAPYDSRCSAILLKVTSLELWGAQNMLILRKIIKNENLKASADCFQRSCKFFWWMFVTFQNFSRGRFLIWRPKIFFRAPYDSRCSAILLKVTSFEL